MKKDNGDTFNNLAQNLVCMVVIAVLGVLFTSWMANVANRDMIDQIARKYILQMETTSYLTGDMKINLEKELKAAGLKNISFDNTTLTKAEYGEDIYLIIKGDFSVFDFRMNDSDKFMELKDDGASWDVYIKKSSIALSE